MPMSEQFEQRLYSKLPRITGRFATPFHIYDERGIIRNGIKLKNHFSFCSDYFNDEKEKGFQEFFAVKALPNPTILKIMHKLGFGFDCSSGPEVILARNAGARPDDIMFTSNNTTFPEFRGALGGGGCILNLDDITLIDKVPQGFPELICFRYNPGERRSGTSIIGRPVEAKYGIRYDQVVEAYRRAKDKGAKRFGIHTMIISNELDYEYMIDTIHMLLELVVQVSKALDIKFEFINIGGGIGIPYKPGENPFNLGLLSVEAKWLFDKFLEKQGYVPKLYMESGRAMTGPYGVLITRVINRMSKYREYVGVDACMSSLMRPAIYSDENNECYHHITVVDENGRLKEGPEEAVDVVGSLCENNDKFARQRCLPTTEEGDFVIIHDTGAHGHSMGFNYNGRLRPKELLLARDGSVKLIRKEEKVEDYFRTMFDFPEDVIPGDRE